jgi:hypothetical protein
LASVASTPVGKAFAPTAPGTLASPIITSLSVPMRMSFRLPRIGLSGQETFGLAVDDAPIALIVTSTATVW